MSKVIYETSRPRYVVEEQQAVGARWESDRGFTDELEAIECAKDNQRLFPDRRYRVMDVTK